MTSLVIRPATRSRPVTGLGVSSEELAEYERLSHLVTATEQTLLDSLFGPHAGAEVLLAFERDAPVGFAVYFHNFSTFLGVAACGWRTSSSSPNSADEATARYCCCTSRASPTNDGCGRFEWAVLDWNEPAIEFYKSLGAVPLDDWTIFRVTGDALEKLAAMK